MSIVKLSFIHTKMSVYLKIENKNENIHTVTSSQKQNLQNKNENIHAVTSSQQQNLQLF